MNITSQSCSFYQLNIPDLVDINSCNLIVLDNHHFKYNQISCCHENHFWWIIVLISRDLIWWIEQSLISQIERPAGRLDEKVTLTKHNITTLDDFWFDWSENQVVHLILYVEQYCLTRRNRSTYRAMALSAGWSWSWILDPAVISLFVTNTCHSLNNDGQLIVFYG